MLKERQKNNRLTLVLRGVVMGGGCVPGETFQVQLGATVFEVTAPEGCGEGSSISIEAEADGEAKAAQPEKTAAELEEVWAFHEVAARWIIEEFGGAQETTTRQP